MKSDCIVLSISVWVILINIPLINSKIPVITDQPLVANLYEGETTEQQLLCIPCIADGPYRIDFISMTPSSPCDKCFFVYPVDQEKTQYCLKYWPSESSNAQYLDYAQARQYDITITCTDNNTEVSTAAIIQVRILTNEAPSVKNRYYYPDNCSLRDKDKNNEVFKVMATDPNDDTLTFTMATEPPNQKFEIGKHDGVIKTTNEYTPCVSDVTLFVNVSDGHRITGPLVIACKNDNVQIPVVIYNANRKVYVREDVPIEETIHEFVSDSAITVTPSDVFYISNDKLLKLRTKLDYENGSPRSYNLSVIPAATKCSLTVYWLQVNVLDANDQPHLTPKSISNIQFDEGHIDTNILNYLSFHDDDQQSGYDSWKFEIIEGNDLGYFQLNPTTGQLISDNYDVDLDRRPGKVSLKINVSDTKGGQSKNDTAIFEFSVLDINDNPPVFEDYMFSKKMSCNTQIGTILTTLKAKDPIDSEFRQNNKVECIPTSSGGIRVDSNCKIYLDSQMVPGEYAQLDVYARDVSGVPGPLKSVLPSSVLVTQEPCTTTTVTPTPHLVIVPANPSVVFDMKTVIVKKIVTTPKPPVTPIPLGSCTGLVCDTGALVGLVFAGLIGIALLGALTYLIYKKCFPCKWDVEKTRSKPTKANSQPKPKTAKPKTPPRKVKPETPPKPKTPEPPRSPTPEPHIYDFWKERFPDDDYVKIPI